MSNNQVAPFSPMTLMNAVTTGTGGILLVAGDSERLTISVLGSGTISGGTLILEESYYNPEGPVSAGTWSQLVSVTASTLSGGVEQIYHFPASIWAVRARISSNITGGGTITVTAWGN